MEKPNETIMLAELKAEYNRKSNEIARRREKVLDTKNANLYDVDERYHREKRQLLETITDIRRKKVGLDKDDPLRLALTDEIRNIEDKLSILHDERNIHSREIHHAHHRLTMEFYEEFRELGEWYDAETIRIKKEVMDAKEAERKAATEEGGEQ